MYQPYQQADPPAIDEWTLHAHLREDDAFDKLEEHYKTFIVCQLMSFESHVADYSRSLRPRRTLLRLRRLV